MRPSDDFERHRRLLFSIAYRMLGTVVDAEDVLQDAYLRWQQADAREIRSPRAWLTSVVTRLCIDQLRSARRRREQYVGPWLPEPLVTSSDDPAALSDLADSMSMAFLVVLEALSPDERAVFLLHDVFGYEFGEVAEFVGKEPANCRQIARRARERLRDGRPRFSAPHERSESLANEFFAACRNGDLEGVMSLLTDDVTVHSDGGGKVPAARRPVSGARDVARFFAGIVKKAPPDLRITPTRINGCPGCVSTVAGRPINVVVFECDGDRIARIYIVNNPEKLTRIELPTPNG